MESETFASIDLAWATLRYAEVEHRNGTLHPLRLGSCDFDFNVAHDLLHAAAPDHLDVVAEALTDVFHGAASRQLRVVVHPPDAYAFVTVVPAGLSASDRTRRFQQEAALLAGTEDPATLHVTAEAVHAETHLDVEPVQVLAVSDALHARFGQLLEALPQTEVQWMLSTQAAGRVIAHGDESLHGTGETAFTMAVGVYPDYIEYALLRNGGWYYSHYVDAEDPVDAAYFATALLDRLEIPPAAITRIGLYGIGADATAFAPFETVFEVAPASVDPFGVLGLKQNVAQGDFGAGAYVPCVGAAL